MVLKGKLFSLYLFLLWLHGMPRKKLPSLKLHAHMTWSQHAFTWGQVEDTECVLTIGVKPTGTRMAELSMATMTMARTLIVSLLAQNGSVFC